MLQNTQLQEMENKIHQICNQICTVILNTIMLYKNVVLAKPEEEVQMSNILFLIDVSLKDNEKLNDIHLIIYAIIAYCFDESEIAKLESLREIVKAFSNIVQCCANSLIKGDPARISIVVRSYDAKRVNVVLCPENDNWISSDLFKVLYLLAATDSIKKDIYFRFMGNNYIRDFVYYGNEFEKEYA